MIKGELPKLMIGDEIKIGRSIYVLSSFQDINGRSGRPKLILELDRVENGRVAP